MAADFKTWDTLDYTRVDLGAGASNDAACLSI